MLELFALAANPPAPAPGTDSILYNLTHGMVPFAIIAMAVMYYMMIVPKRKQDRERRQMLTDMKRGDEVQTIGGIIGKVVDPREDRVLVKVDESSNTKIWFARSAIARVTAEDVKAAVGKETR